MIRLLATAAVLALATPLGAAPAAEVTTQLPRTVRPSHYDIAITPDAAAMTFAGKVGIAVEVIAPTTTITLNAADLAFDRVALSGVAAAPTVKVDADAQTATFTFAQAIAPGRYTLSIDYRGKIGTQANGLFALDYDTPAGKKRALYTQFENSDARRLIPSWDEPAYKATFTLAATVPSGQMAVSNLPVASTKDLGGGKALVSFPETPKMSTYLLFFGLGDFERITAKAGPTEIGIITQTGKAAQGRFILDSDVAVLNEYNDYFDVPFPLPKLDNIAAPGSSQFFSAMENWGAIFTFERSIILDPTISTQADKERAFTTAAHETAHQWFGDLVTMAWWDDLWLNEGFASWMESRTTAKLHPEWNTRLAAVNIREGAESRDSLATTHPIVQHVATVEQASQAFDAITYAKGEAVIRMLEDYAGSDVWRAGVRRYIARHAYGNTTTDDLWREVDAVSPGRPITEIAHRFTLQPGVPLIRVAAACSGGRTTLTLAQGEFSKDRPGKAPLAWPVPVTAATLGGAAGKTVVVGGRGSLTVGGCAPVVVNAGQAGYYRTLYAPAAFAALSGGFAQVPAIDQLGIMSDAWALGLAGYQPASDFLDLARVVPASASPAVVAEIARVFVAIDDYLRGDAAARARFRTFAVGRLHPAFAAIGWPAPAGAPAPGANLREALITTLGKCADADVVAEARRRFAAQSSDPAATPAAIRKAVLYVVATNADAATWDALHRAAAAEKTPLVKRALYDALAATADPMLAQRALDLALTDEPGATNSPDMLRAVADEFPEMAYDFALVHVDAVDRLVDASSRSRFFPALATGSSDPAMVGKIKAYADKYLRPGARRDADTAAAAITYRVKVIRERLPAITAWVAKNG